MKPIIKKPDLLIIKKAIAPESSPQPASQVDAVDEDQPIIEQKPPVEPQSRATEYLTPYAPVQDYPILQSVSNSGWQPSDIWRDLRIDGFCE